jgi:mannosyltransferase OCH1-like enzyme
MGFLHGLGTVLIDSPFSALEDQEASVVSPGPIPRVVYQTWEKNSFGRRFIKSLKMFRSLNKDLSFVLFDKEARDKYMSERWLDRPIYEIYQKSQFGALRADIFRYCLIFDRGGFYFDISKGLDTQLSKLFRNDALGVMTFENNPFLGEEGPSHLMYPRNLVVQWGFGFAPGSEILSRQIDRIESSAASYKGRIFAVPKEAILQFTGPIAFTKTVHEFASARKMDGIDQLGIDFHGHGIFSLNGSGSRYLSNPSYATAKNKSILL